MLNFFGFRLPKHLHVVGTRMNWTWSKSYLDATSALKEQFHLLYFFLHLFYDGDRMLIFCVQNFAKKKKKDEKRQWTQHFQNAIYLTEDYTSDFFIWLFKRMLLSCQFPVLTLSLCQTTAAESECITCFALVYSDEASSPQPVWNGRLHTEAFDAGTKRQKKRKRKEAGLLHSATHSPPPPATTSDSPPLSNRQHCCRGCHGVGLLSIMSHAPSQPDAPPGPPACVRSRSPRDVSFGNHERPTASCRGSREKVGAVESHQREKECQHLQRRARRAECVFTLGSGFYTWWKIPTVRWHLHR